MKGSVVFEVFSCDSEFESFSESPSQDDKQQPPWNHQQPPSLINQLNEDEGSDYVFEGFYCDSDSEFEGFSCDSECDAFFEPPSLYGNEQPPWNNQQPPPQLDQLFEKLSEPPSQCDKQQPPWNHRQPPVQLDEVNGKWVFCRQKPDNSEACLLVVPLLKKNPNFDEFGKWVSEVEWFFELFQVPEDDKVELAALRLGEAFAWSELMQNISMEFNKQPIQLTQEWTLMKDMLKARFFSP